MRKSPFFSIIIPTLDEEKYLPTLLKNLKQQSWQDFEVIVVDANSQDKTVLLAKKFQSKLPALTIVSETEKNVSLQRNLGAKKAKGQVWLFIDADSQLPSYFLLGLKYHLEANQTDIFSCYLKPDSHKPQDKAVAYIMNLAMDASNKVFERAGALGAFIGCKPKFFKKIKGFDPTIKYGEDTDFVQRMVDQGLEYSIFKHPRFVYSFRRLRKEGKLGLLYKYTKLALKILKTGPPKEMPSEYPMLGGTFYTKTKRKTQLTKKLEKIYREFLEALAK